MEEIELRPAESYAVAGPSLRFVLRVELNNSTEIFVDVPGGHLRRGHTKIVVQGIEDSTSVTLSKPDGLAFESGTRVFITLDQLVDTKTGEVVSVSLPPYVLSGRKRFTPVSITRSNGEYTLTAANSDTPGGAELSEGSDVIRESVAGALHSIQDDFSKTKPAATSESLQPTKAYVLLDVSASARKSIDPELLKRISSVIDGVLQSSHIDVDVGTSSSMTSWIKPGRGDSIYELWGKMKYSQIVEVGWTLDITSLDDEAVLIVVSDDLPAGVIGRVGPTHVLCSRTPMRMSSEDISVFDSELRRKLMEGDSRAFDECAEKIYRTISKQR